MRRVIVVLLAILALMVVAVQCQTDLFGEDETGARDVAEALRQLVERRHPDSEFIQVIDVEPIDVDDDPEEEWLLFYRFDPFRTGNFANAPVQARLYDVVTCEFPEFVSYDLPTPDNDYLSEGSIAAEVTDFLESGDRFNAASELIIYGDVGAKRSILSIFRFRDTVQDPCREPQRPREGLQLLGYFDADVKIDLTGNRITTWRRTAFERSQLGIRSLYLPRNAPDGSETYRTDEGGAISPEEQSVDFVFGLPDSPSDSPYPEKAVAAFYLYMGVDTEKAGNFLTEELQQNYPNGKFGLPYLVSEVEEVLIFSITYQPNEVKEQNREDRTVVVTVLADPADDTKLAMAGTCTIVWRVASRQPPPGAGVDATAEATVSSSGRSNDLEWRLAEILDVSGDSRCGR